MWTGLPFGSSGGWIEPVKDERWAADLAALEAADRAVQAYGCAVLVELDDVALDAVQVAGAGVVVDADAVTDVEHRERFGRADRVQQLMARPDRIGDRGQMQVQFAGRDLVKQEALGFGCRVWWRDARGPRRLQLGLDLAARSLPGALAHTRQYPKRCRRVKANC